MALLGVGQSDLSFSTDATSWCYQFYRAVYEAASEAGRAGEFIGLDWLDSRAMTLLNGRLSVVVAGNTGLSESARHMLSEGGARLIVLAAEDCNEYKGFDAVICHSRAELVKALKGAAAIS